MTGKMGKHGGKGSYAAELLAAIIIYALAIPSLFNNQVEISGSMFLAMLAYILLLLFMIALYVAKDRIARAWLIFNIAFAGTLACIVCMFAVSPSIMASGLFLNIMSFIVLNYYLLLVYALLLFLASASAYLFSRGRKAYGCAALVPMLAVLLLQYFYLMHGIAPFDETLQAFYFAGQLEHGINPYNASIAGILYNASKSNEAEVAYFTTNQYTGARFTYPFLYEMVSLPFFYLLPHTIYNLSHTELPIETLLFTFILVLVIAFNASKKDLLKPKFAIIVLLAMLSVELTSPILVLAAALLILCYQMIGSRYAWLLLGLAVSLQEYLWFPALLLAIYYFSEKGPKAGAKLAIGAAAVFLLINGYFILLGPNAYANALTADAFSYQMPNIQATIGYFLLTYYHVQISSLNLLFDAVMLFLACAFAYLRKKEQVALFTFVPYLFLAHSLTEYYLIPALLFAFIMYSEQPALKRNNISRRFKVALGIVMVISATGAVAAVYYGHLAYTHNFNLAITNQTLVDSGNETIYSATLSYHDPVPGTLYFGIYSGSSSSEYYQVALQGFDMQQVLASNETQCTSYDCMQNLNKITINDSNSTYKIRAILPDFGANPSAPIGYAKAVIYYGRYYYTANIVEGHT